MRRVLLALVCCGVVAGCSGPLAPVLPRGGDDQRPESRGVATDGWTIDVSVEPSAVGPIHVSVRGLRRAPTNDARPWIQHELVFENGGARPITLADTRRSTIVGPRGRRALLAADVGCGYGFSSPRAPIDPGACATYLDILTVEPRRSARRTITLFKGLRGLDRLEAGTYVFEKPIRFQAGRELPEAGAGRAAVLRIVYELERDAR